MAIYKSLLLSEGGGVISPYQQAEQNGDATIAIGLGGTGVACLRNLKRQIFNRIRPDNPDSSIPRYEHIRFLAVDSDKSSLEADGAFYSLNDETEFFSLFCENINDLLSDPKRIEVTKEFDWLKIENKDKGQKGIRIPSRLTAGRRQGRLFQFRQSFSA